MEPDPAPVVVKVSGSLFDLPDLGPRLTRWLAQFAPDPNSCRVLLIPGGGPTTDAVRALDRCHGLGEERAHWLALHALALNAHFLAGLLPNTAVAESLEDCARYWRAGMMPVLDALAFARADEGRPGRLPHGWDVTSDAVAARVAQVARARTLVLLKSVSFPEGIAWTEAARLGLVDAHFAAQVGPALAVVPVNLRG